MVELRTAQKLFLEKVEESRKNGNNKGLLIFATGLGKSLSAMADALRVAGKKGKILVLAHNHNLLYQLAEDFKLLHSDKKIGFLYSSKKDINAEALFANVRTIQNKKYLELFKPDYFDYIIVDETHHAVAKSYKNIFEHFKPKFFLGMTATPNRPDNLDINSLYGHNILMDIDSFDAINKKWLRPYKYVFMWDKWCDYKKVKSSILRNGYHKYDIKSLGKHYFVPERDVALISKFKEKAGDRRGIGFCISIDEAIRMADLFNNNGIHSVAIWGASRKGKTMHVKERDKILEDFKNGKYQMLFNCDLIGEGLHLPSVDVILKLRPTQSPIKDNQHNGRGLYNVEGLELDKSKHKKLLILDWVGNYNKSYFNFLNNGRLDKNALKNKSFKNIREVVKLPIGCEVEFEERVIEEFNMQIILDSNSKKWEDLNKRISLFYDKYGHNKVTIRELKKFDEAMYIALKRRGRLGEFCVPLIKTLDRYISWYRKKYGDKKITPSELMKENPGMYAYLFRHKKSHEFCESTQKTLEEQISWYRKKYGKLKIYRTELQKINIGMYHHLLKEGRLDEFCLPPRRGYRSSEYHSNLYRKKYGKLKIYRTELQKINTGMYHYLLKEGRLDEFCLPPRTRNIRTNLTITSSYKPKIILPVNNLKKKGVKKSYEGLHKKQYKSHEDKTDIRNKIISKIQDGDNILILESPELSALKEIEKQGKKPSKIIIPNNSEFKKLAANLKNYKTNLNIECINTSALQYLVDSEEKFDFIWLDYCGAFSYYIRDLDILFQKHLGNMKLILTYNLFDPAKEDDSYYFTRVIDYILSKNQDRNVRLINDITYRYKKQMYNLGFNIQSN